LSARTQKTIFHSPRFSWQATGLYSITAVVSFVTAFPGQEVQPSIIFGLAVVLASAIAIFISLIDFINSKSLNSRFQNSQIWFFILVLLIGVVRGLGFFYLVEINNIAQPTPLLVRLATSAINTLIWLTFSCALVEATTNYSRRFSKLFNETTMALALTSRIPSRPDVDSLDNVISLKRNLAGILEKASAHGVSANELIRAGAAVRSQIEELIRPLSHRLWFNQRRNKPEVRLYGLIGDSISQFSFVSWRFLFVWAALAFASIVNAYPMDRVLFGIAMSVALLAGVIALYRVIPKSFVERQGTRLTLFFIIFISTVPVSLADIVMPFFSFQRMLFPVSAATLLSPIAIVVLLLVESCVRLVEQDRNWLNNLFETKIKEEIIQIQSSLASYLHNSLQSELTGIAYRLEASATTPDSAEAREALEKLGAIINRSISDDFANFEETPLDRLNRMISAWNGIAKVTTRIDDDCKTDLKRLNLIVQVIEESTTNSVRHGKARNIHVEVTKADNRVIIDITTDATEREIASSGLGSKWLVENSLHVSTLSHTDSGTQFRVEI
jgi:signal transduction histidine kinase